MIQAIKNCDAELEGQYGYAWHNKNIPQIKRRLHKVDTIKKQKSLLSVLASCITVSAKFGQRPNKVDALCPIDRNFNARREGHLT